MRRTDKGSFRLGVLYSQIAVFDTNVGSFNDWKPEHVQQGFAWRPGSVSFGTFKSSGYITVEVQLAGGVELRGDSMRAIRVPFAVGPDANLEVAVIGEQRRIDIPPGEYALVFEHGLSESRDDMWCVFTFVPDDAAEPAILITDPELSPPTPLLMEADPV